MTARRWSGAAAAAVALAFAAGPAAAQRAGGAVKAARADFADMAGGSYLGEIVSGAHGAPRGGVRVNVTKTGPNQVRVTSDPPRLPAFTARLVRATDTLRNVGGDQIFVLDLSKRPRTLAVTVDGASWKGTKD